MSTASTLPGYSTAAEIAARLGVTPSRIRQLLMELREHGQDVGYLVGTVRLFDARDSAIIERAHTAKRTYTKSSD